MITCSEIVIGSKLKSALLLGSLTQEESQFVCGKIGNWFDILYYDNKIWQYIVSLTEEESQFVCGRIDIEMIIISAALINNIIIINVHLWSFQPVRCLPPACCLDRQGEAQTRIYDSEKWMRPTKILTFLEDFLSQVQVSFYQGLKWVGKIGQLSANLQFLLFRSLESLITLWLCCSVVFTTYNDKHRQNCKSC